MNFQPPGPRSRRGLVRLELTSMIDVIFLLLVYFILSTTYTPPESQLGAALSTRSDTTGRSAELTPQIIEVGILRGAPGFGLGSRIYRDRESLAAALSGLSKEGGLIVRGSAAANVSHIAAAMQAARDAGFERVTYVPAQ